MSATTLDAVTGAFSYSGRSIAEALLRRERKVRTLTGHPGRQAAYPGLAGIEVLPLDFGDRDELTRSLEGVTTLYNTYWVRFARGTTTHEAAVSNSRILFGAARQAGVERIVHVSITHPSTDSPYPYFRGKALVEQALADAGVPFATVRPGILFGGEGVLVNNIAWLLRHLPIFGVAGRGDYRLRPIHVDDLAELCITLGQLREDSVHDAVGPERPTFDELVHQIMSATGARARIVHVHPRLVPPISAVLGRALHDVLLTPEELHAMMEGLADTTGPATGTTELSRWLTDHGDDLGRRYANELKLHF